MQQSARQYLRLLFWLKWKLQWRAYTRNRMSALGAVLVVIFFGPAAIGVAAACAFGFLTLEPPLNAYLLSVVLLAIYLLWLLAPVFGYALSESYDVTRLFHFPVSPRLLFVSAIFGSLLDFPVLLVLPTMAAVVIGFAHGPVSLLLTLIAVLLFTFHTIALSQVFVLAGAGMLRSRRFRDLAIILAPLLFMGFYLATQLLSSRMRTSHLQGFDWQQIVNHPAWRYLDFAPPGFAARIIADTGQGTLAATPLYLLGLLIACLGTVYLAGWLINLAATGHVVGSSHHKPAVAAERRAATPAAAAHQPARSRLGDLLPPAVAAVVGKELKYMLREPYFKTMLLNIFFMLVVGVFVFLRPWRREITEFVDPGLIVWAASGYVFFAEIQLLMNILGTEGRAATALFLFPNSRRHLLLGKNLAMLGALFFINLVVAAVLCSVAGRPGLIGPMLVWMELANVILAGVGNIASVLFPIRIVRVGWRMQAASSGRSCAYGFAYMLFMAAGGLLLLPVLAAALVPSYWISPLWLALTLPVAGLYAVGIYVVALNYAESLLLKREPEIVAALTEEE